MKTQTSLWPSEQNFKSNSTACVSAGGYSVHAETAIKANERERLEKLVRYMARPAISDERVIIEGPQSIRVKLKSRWTDGTESQGRGKGRRTKTCKRRLTWAALLKRTFKIDVLTCGRCGGSVLLEAPKLLSIRSSLR